MSANADPLVQVVRAVQKGVRWLKEWSTSATDARDMAIALSALMAVERNRHSQLVQRLGARLRECQDAQGSWNEELWDTAWAMEALRHLGVPPDAPELVRGTAFLAATRDEERSCWYEEPFETLLVVDIIVGLPVPALVPFAVKALEWVLDIQDATGRLVGVRYTGMLISTLLAAERAGLGSFTEPIDRAVTWLRDDMSGRRIWTNAAWSNAYPLRALAQVGFGLDDPLVAKAVRWFVESQDGDGKWAQVARVDDTAMALRTLTAFLREPLVDVQPPKTGVLEAKRHDGTLFVSFQTAGPSAIRLGERFKVEPRVHEELAQHQRRLLTASTRARAARTVQRTSRHKQASLSEQLYEIGQYTFGHLFPSRVQRSLAEAGVDHLLFEVDEPLIDLPWELAHDGKDFLCLRFAMGRRLVSDDAPSGRRRSIRPELSVLIVADPTENLPGAREEGAAVTALLRGKQGLRIDLAEGRQCKKRDFLLALRRYDVIHFAGHALYDPKHPDESCLSFSDGEIRAFEIERFTAESSPSLVFLNACWSAQELSRPDAYPRLMRGLGRTFLFAGADAFVGYLVPVPDVGARVLAQLFYTHLALGQTIGEALRLSRTICREEGAAQDITWASAVLYGDPSTRLLPPLA